MILGPDGRPLKRPETSEIATLSRLQGIWTSVMNILPNPDPILAKTGKSIQIGEEMRADAHIWSCLTSRKSGVLSKDWDVLPASDEPKDIEIAEFVKSCFEDFDFDAFLRQMLDAVFDGYTIHEVIWAERNGKWVIDALKDRPQDFFGFDPEINLRMIPLGRADGELLPPAKFIINQHEGSETNPYGVRLASKCYWPWMFKKHGYKFWAIFVEKYGMPLALGKYSAGASEKDKRDLLQALVDMVQDAAVAIPDTTNIEYKEAGNAKGEIHHAFLDFFNSEISKAILGQTLTTEPGDRGAYSLGKVHQGVKQEIVEADAKMLMSTINNTLVWWLTDFNFGPVQKYPKFVIHYQEPELKKEQAERDRTLVEMGLPISAKYFYSQYNIPQPEDGEELVRPPSPAPPPAAFSEQDFSQKMRKAAEEQDLKKVQRKQERLDAFVSDAIRRGIDHHTRMAQELFSQIGKWDGIRREQIEQLDLPRSLVDRLGTYLLAVAGTGYLLGELGVWEDYADAEQEADESASFAEEDEEPYRIKVIPVTFDEAIAYFRKLMPIDPEKYKRLEEELKEKYFTIARLEGEAIVAKVKQYLDEALEEGITPEEFIRKSDEYMQRMGLAPADPWHLETVYRTNIQTAYHAGQWELLQSPAMDDMFPYLQYHAIQDRRTRPDHLAMHGQVFPKDDPIWNEWYPPNGYNCRCTVIAINKYRAKRLGIQPKRSHVPGEPDKGFGGRPSQALREIPSNMST